MKRYMVRMGVIPSLLLGAGLFVIGVMAVNHVVENWWPFDVGRLDLVRAAALDRADAALLLEAANSEILLAFLAGILVAVTGLVLPFAFILNKRFGRNSQTESGDLAAPRFLVTLRQSMWVGVWVAFCTWLQMNRALGFAVAGLVAAVLAMFELLLQVRARTETAAVSEEQLSARNP